MAVNRSLHIKELVTIPSLNKDNYLALSDGSSSPVTSIITYKTTLGTLASFIGQQGLVPPVVLTDAPNNFVPAYGVMTVSSGLATLSVPADYAAIEVGDVIVFINYPNTYPATVVTSKGAFPYLGVVSSIDITTGTAFYYGKGSIITKSQTGVIANTISSAGTISVGSLIVLGSSSIAQSSYFNTGGASVDGEVFVTDAVRCSTYTSYPTIGYADMRSADDTYIVQRNVDDGMVSYYHRPFLNAVMVSDQTMTTGVWNPVAFTVTTGADPQSTTHYRNVVGSPAYDTTNYAFPIPYTTDYPAVAYMIHAQVLVEITAGPGSRFYIDVFSGSTATGDTLILCEKFFRFSVNTVNSYLMIDVSRMVYLRPLSVADHRWIRVKCWLTSGGGNSATIISTPEDTYFNAVCLG